jgi:hypothetical protein
MEQGKSNLGTIVLTVIITAAVVGAGVYFLPKYFTIKVAETTPPAEQATQEKEEKKMPEKEDKKEDEQAKQEPEKKGEPVVVEEKKTPSDSEKLEILKKIAGTCEDFPDKLEQCTKYSCEFMHPIMGGQMEKEIRMVGDKCNYTEELPNNGLMECNFTESQRKIAAAYYRSVAGSTSFKMKVTIDLGSGEVETDGAGLEQAMTKMMNDVCVFTGYD